MTRVVLDTCVLIPTLLRQILFCAARHHVFECIISDQILSEWAHVAQKSGGLDMLEAGTAITDIRQNHASWIKSAPQEQRQFWLPDASDIHVLALAVSSHADGIVTHNAKDFPKDLLAEYGLVRMNPDQLLTNCNNTDFCAEVGEILRSASAASGGLSHTKLLAKAWLPRFAHRFARMD